ncbi:ubiquitinyl hydrolase [Suhomyces tanzawaensis NRRL Y-17324]|uniref:Ubiquitin carboxyl-terminal hydrolase n=1 Tax=Suhomyces tanzawaensis NRRL Y-17324 TaxID=984487 RepID=A0A1E4SGQ9_9ASCO|nr:ubiquitinyl hydrolase [Suhomyces tanzawaensis NRRL Y-17324]ODV78694.1 ubiquitinyl hydrolase [Suhomyces tanzawaensis NRRL Y-17324]
MSESGWNTIDSDAGVFTELVEKLQIQNVEINDLYAIDTDSLRSLDPLYGVIFLFKYGKVDRDHAQDGNKPLTGQYDPSYQDKGIFFANQTIQNACATQAVLNVLFNKDELDLGPELANFKAFVTGFDSEMIGDTISNSELIRSVHNSFSAPNSLILDSEKKPEDHDDKNDGLFHFVGYLRTNGHIYELDGLKSYPIKHTACESNDQFYEKLPLVIQERISKYDMSELRFSLLGITNNKLQASRELGDVEGINIELNKREMWKKENELRRHDYTGLIVELLKSVSRNSTDDEWQALLNDARKKGQLDLLETYAKRGMK